MNVLCVGGPVDGRRVVLRDNQGHYSVVEHQCVLVEMSRDDPTPITTTVHHYNLFRLHPVTRGVVFAHESLTPTQIMEALMDGYRSEARQAQEKKP